MRIKKKNIARLASLSALGAGALGVAAGTAQAGIVSYTYPSPVTVGPAPGGQNSAQVFLPGLNVPNFKISRSTFGNTISGGWRVYAKGGADVRFRNLGGFLGIVSGGATWSAVGIPGGASVPIAFRNFNPNQLFGDGNFANKYAMFRFTSDAAALYGWLQLSNVVSLGAGPEVTLLAYAYDDSGARIVAGDIGGVPEPSTMALTGLAALALGATGLRRWRAARTPAA